MALATTSRLIRALTTLSLLIFSFRTVRLAGAEPRSLQEGWVVTLDRGSLLDVVILNSWRAEGVARTVILRDRESGESITARDESDFVWGTAVLEVSDGVQRMKLRMGLDFFKDGQAAPVELKIGEEIHRALWDPPACPGSARAKQKLQAAASRLPARMLREMKELYAISFDEELGIESVGAGIELLFSEGLPRTPVVGKKRLTTEEIEAVLQKSPK